MIHKDMMVLNTEWTQVELIELLNESAPRGASAVASGTSSVNLNASLGASSKCFLNSSQGGLSSGSSSGFGFGITGNKSTGVVVKAITSGGSAARVGIILIILFFLMDQYFLFCLLVICLN